MKQAVLSAILLPGFLIFYEPVKQGYLDSAVQIPDFCSEQRQDYRKLTPGKINFQGKSLNSVFSKKNHFRPWSTIYFNAYYAPSSGHICGEVVGSKGER